MKEVASAMAGLAILWLLFPVLFTDREEFMECIKFWLTSDIFSLFRGEYWEDSWAEFKLFIWLACAAAVGYGMYHLL